MANENRIKELREQRGFKRSKVAAAFDVDQSTVYRWEQVGPPRDLIPQLSRYLGVDSDFMMGWDREAA